MRHATLREVAVDRGLVGGPFGSSLVNADYTDSGVPVIRGANMSVGRYIGGDFVYVSDEKFAHDLARNSASPGDVVYTQRGTLGQVCLVPPGTERYVVSQSQMRLRVNPDIADARFIYYASTTPAFIKQVHDRAISTGVPHTNLGILSELEVPLPPLREQQAIAEVLGALDDKIAANTKLAATADNYLAAEFAMRAETESDIAELREVADVNQGSVKPVADGMLRYVDIASVGVGKYAYPDATRWADAPSRARRRLCHGDTMWSTVRPNRRSHALNLSDDPLLVASTGLAVLSPRRVGFAYLYEATKRPEFTAYLENVAEGSAYPAVRAERFLDAPILMFAPDQVVGFERIAAPIREQIDALDAENRILAATRDALLPQLMSGKLRVRDAEAVASGVGV